ncbi:MAG: hypothetical protein ABNH26_08590 [Celeribacter sp.]|jgi:hypothetical protein
MTDQERIEALEREVRILRHGLSASVIMIIESLGVHQKSSEEQDKAFEHMRNALEVAGHVYASGRIIGETPMINNGGKDE